MSEGRVFCLYQDCATHQQLHCIKYHEIITTITDLYRIGIDWAQTLQKIVDCLVWFALRYIDAYSTLNIMGHHGTSWNAGCVLFWRRPAFSCTQQQALIDHCWCKGSSIINYILVGGFNHVLLSISLIWDVILPIDEVIFFKMVIAPPTRFYCQLLRWVCCPCWTERSQPHAVLIYPLVMTNSSPWKITMLLRTVNHLFLWAIYTMAMLNNQRVFEDLVFVFWQSGFGMEKKGTQTGRTISTRIENLLTTVAASFAHTVTGVVKCPILGILDITFSSHYRPYT